MKKAMLAVVFLAFLGSVWAGEAKRIYPGGHMVGPDAALFVTRVNGLAIGEAGIASPSLWTPEVFKTQVHAMVYLIGNDARNATIMAAAWDLVFPELGDDAKSGSGACYCSSSIGGIDTSTPEIQVTGRGKCFDAMICYIKGIPGPSN